ncbi:MAG: DUF1223 domain-containing protein [Thermoanaerobaculia bacterium]
MRKLKHTAVLVGIALVAFASASCSDAPVGAQTGSPATGSQASSPIVVELFTSQGCSSCPPADRYLSELAERTDVEIIPLSFHVDYWNYIGWTDPFSSEAWSDRQRRYARALGGNRIYTPQMVVNGRWVGVGSNRRDISRLLERARAEPSVAEVGVSAELVSDDRLRIAVSTSGVYSRLEGENLAAWVAVVESELETAVGRGENASKSLRNDRVVRKLERVQGLDLAEPGVSTTLEVGLEPEWLRDKLSIAAFLQETDSLRIRAAAQTRLAD